jgi:hypothetical protein
MLRTDRAILGAEPAVAVSTNIRRIVPMESRQTPSVFRELNTVALSKILQGIASMKK